MSNKNGYDVGYGKPPRSGMFKQGQSGNPKGRPKGARNFRIELEEILESKVTVTESGKPRKVTTTRAAFLRLKEKALKGDQRALEKLLAYAEETASQSDARSREKQLSKFEQDILDRFSFTSDDAAEDTVDE